MQSKETRCAISPRVGLIRLVHSEIQIEKSAPFGKATEHASRKTQRLAVAKGYPQHSAEDDRVVPGVMGVGAAAFEPGNRAGQDGRAFRVQRPWQVRESGAAARKCAAQLVLLGPENMDGKMGGCGEQRVFRRTLGGRPEHQGGSRDTEAKLLTVMPIGPWSAMAVTTVTPVVKLPSAFR